MALPFLLLLGGFCIKVVSPESPQNTMTWISTPPIKTPSTSEAWSANSSAFIGPVTENPKETISPWRQTPIPVSSTPLGTTELSSVGTSAGASMSIPVPEATFSQKVSSRTSVLLPETSNVASDPPVTITSPVFPETSNVASDPPVTVASPVLPETSNVASDPSVTVANPVTERTVTSISTFKGTRAPPDTVTTSSEETSGPSLATTVSSKTSGLPATIATSSVESSSVASGTPFSRTKIFMPSTRDPITTRSPRQGSRGMLLVPLLIALMVVLAIVALLLLWRQRQKRRTGALTLSRGGKRNGVVDAWAGPARVPDEEATTTSGSGGNKGSGVLEAEGSGQRPTLTTFFSRRKSRQGSLVLEELKPGSGPNLKGEEEPLVGSEDEAVETPTSDGPQAKAEAAPQSL
ncbi:leukosialin isoform X2 [Mastomys coucha]|uniref:leukosialin isoform X2 n=1 Tax=Mastomys coucha TaxID=35658 RepID=UPI001261B927|nr:leukosialin isoform X2 [Mastomys coucha]